MPGFSFGALWVQRAVHSDISRSQHVSVAVNIKIIKTFVMSAGEATSRSRTRKETMIQARCKDCGISFDVYVSHQSHNTKEKCDDCSRKKRSQTNAENYRRRKEMAGCA